MRYPKLLSLPHLAHTELAWQTSEGPLPIYSHPSDVFCQILPHWDQTLRDRFNHSKLPGSLHCHCGGTLADAGCPLNVMPRFSVFRRTLQPAEGHPRSKLPVQGLLLVPGPKGAAAAHGRDAGGRDRGRGRVMVGAGVARRHHRSAGTPRIVTALNCTPRFPSLNASGPLRSRSLVSNFSVSLFLCALGFPLPTDVSITCRGPRRIQNRNTNNMCSMVATGDQY